MTSDSPSAPAIAALFLAVFDKKVGYTVAWHREISGVVVDGVEFKALPSGLHQVRDDLVYFVHGRHVGIGAFVQEDSDEAHRNASFAAVGALFIPAQGVLGRGWMLAESLSELARGAVANPDQTEALEQFWEQRRLSDETGAIASSSSVPRPPRMAPRSSSTTTLSAAMYGNDESPTQPALAVPGLLDLFGPLLFPIHRAALRGQRILFMGSAPVRQACNAVYLLSILASLPDGLSKDTLRLAERLARPRPLFNIGIHDIPTLSEPGNSTEWIACTTDDILRDKTALYDILVELPSSSPAENRTSWPQMRTSAGAQIRATQRDLRRYKLLRLELRRMRLQRRIYHSSTSSVALTPIDNSSEADREELLMRTSSVLPSLTEADDGAVGPDVVEPMTWTELACSSLSWWHSSVLGGAGAGGFDHETFVHAEAEADRELLDDLPDLDVGMPSDDDAGESAADHDMHLRRHQSQAIATVVVAYFRQLTAKLVHVMTDIAKSAADDNGQDVDGPDDGLVIDADDMVRIGLDAWSGADKEFVRDMMMTLTRRDVVVDTGEVRICGVRVC